MFFFVFHVFSFFLGSQKSDYLRQIHVFISSVLLRGPLMFWFSFFCIFLFRVFPFFSFFLLCFCLLFFFFSFQDKKGQPPQRQGRTSRHLQGGGTLPNEEERANAVVRIDLANMFCKNYVSSFSLLQHWKRQVEKQKTGNKQKNKDEEKIKEKMENKDIGKKAKVEGKRTR